MFKNQFIERLDARQPSFVDGKYIILLTAKERGEIVKYVLELETQSDPPNTQYIDQLKKSHRYLADRNMELHREVVAHEEEIDKLKSRSTGDSSLPYPQLRDVRRERDELALRIVGLREHVEQCAVRIDELDTLIDEIHEKLGAAKRETGSADR